MLSNLSETCGRRLLALDGEIGCIEDFLFDELDWAVRYLVASSDEPRREKPALVPTSRVGYESSERRGLPVLMSLRDLEDSASFGDLMRSAGGLLGYEVSAGGEAFGRVEDILLDRMGWTLRYLAVGPGGRTLISPDWLERVDWQGAKVRVDLSPHVLLTAPKRDGPGPVGREFEARLYDHCDRPRYW